MNAIEFINTLKPLLADYQAAADREAKAAKEKAGALGLIGLLFKELFGGLTPEQQALIWLKPFTVWMPDGSAFQVKWGDGLRQVSIVTRLETFKELLPQEGGADAT